MLHHYYYVDGKRVSMEQYYAACDLNAYMHDAFKKAKDYFERNPWAWIKLCNITKGVPSPEVMILHYEWTPEGKAFKEEWKRKSRKQEKIAYIIGFLVLSAPLVALLIMLLSGN